MKKIISLFFLIFTTLCFAECPDLDGRYKTCLLNNQEIGEGLFVSQSMTPDGLQYVWSTGTSSARMYLVDGDIHEKIENINGRNVITRSETFCEDDTLRFYSRIDVNGKFFNRNSVSIRKSHESNTVFAYYSDHSSDGSSHYKKLICW